MSTITQVKERPIIFSAEMVRRILADAKTQTRRILKPQAKEIRIQGGDWLADDGRILKCPHGMVGDRLWVKEAWRPKAVLNLSRRNGDVMVGYAADDTETLIGGERINQEWVIPKQARNGNVTPRYMPRWASRLTLEIKDVRLQRVQDISEEDALAEGVAIDIGHAYETAGYGNAHRTACGCFNTIWNHLHGPEHFEKVNPWVWAITFKKL